MPINPKMRRREMDMTNACTIHGCSDSPDELFVRLNDLQLRLNDSEILKETGDVFCLSHFLKRGCCSVCDKQVSSSKDLSPRHVRNNLHIMVCEECSNDLSWFLPG
jgi:hypothetical protein